MTAPKVYVPAEVVADYIATKVDYLIERIREEARGEAVRMEVGEGFPIVVGKNEDDPANILPMKTKHGYHFAIITLKVLRESLRLDRLRQAEKRAEAEGYTLLMQYVLVSPEMECSADAMRLADDLGVNPLMNTTKWGGMLIDDFSIVLRPSEDARQVVTLGYVETLNAANANDLTAK